MLLCCMQSFLYLGWFLLASVLTPVETDAWWEGQVMTMLFLLSMMVKFYNQFWFASTCMIQLQLNNLTSKRISALLSALVKYSLWLRETKVHTTSHTNLINRSHLASSMRQEPSVVPPWGWLVGKTDSEPVTCRSWLTLGLDRWPCKVVLEVTWPDRAVLHGIGWKDSLPIQNL